MYMYLKLQSCDIFRRSVVFGFTTLLELSAFGGINNVTLLFLQQHFEKLVRLSDDFSVALAYLVAEDPTPSLSFHAEPCFV